MIKYLIISARPRQWVKNIVVFAAVVFSRNALDPGKLTTSIFAFLIFCQLSSVMYLVNDLMDVEKDRVHPVKRRRPMAAGLLPVNAVRITVLVGVFLAALLAGTINRDFLLVAGLYFLLNIAYSLFLKSIVIIDIFSIAFGFVLRAAAGAVAIDVEISNWLLVCVILLSLFLAIGKRRHELTLLGDNAVNHRSILGQYSVALLDQMAAVMTASTVMAYCLYTLSADTLAKFGGDNLKYTIPFVIFGIFRYLYLIHRHDKGDAPEKVLMTDPPLLITVLLYGTAVIVILYF
jgi:4-hydroxybenzoate polyprenyltransferase